MEERKAMKSLGNEQDVQSTKKAMEQAPSWFIGIPDKKTPWHFIGLDYADGYVHWYDVSGQARRVVCAGGLEGKGFATDACPICTYVLELYQDAKRLKEEGEDAKAKQLKERANRLHAKAEVQFKAIRGQRTLLKTTTGKKWIADWDMEDEDSSADIGIITLSEAQFDGLTGMIKGEDTPFITCGDDLLTHVLWTNKERRKGRSGGKYSAVVWDADEAETPVPDVGIDEELLELDLTENFEIDTEEVDKVFSLVSGQEVEEPEEDEAVELEDDSEEVPEDADLDDLPEDEDGESEEEVAEEEDDFEDDPLPESKPKTQKKRTGTASTAKKTATGKTHGKKRSGKARM